MPAAPAGDNEAKRLAAVMQCNVLDTEPEQAFDDLTTLASRLTGCPVSLLTILDEHRQWFKSRVGFERPETPRDQAFCGYAILDDDPLIVEDALADPRVSDNPLVTGEPGIRFYAGVPLLLQDGLAAGTLCVIDTEPRTLSVDEMETLMMLARQASSQLELRRHAFRLRHTTEEAHRASLAKSTFLANMSHEIRTPLTAILGFSELIDCEQKQDAMTREEVLDAAQSIRRNATHLLALVNDVLDITKIESERIQIERVELETLGVLCESIELVRVRAERKGIALAFERASPLPERIETDSVRLRQILVNLLDNAIKFTQRGTVTMRCGFDEAAGQLVVDIIDTGVGMTPEQLERVRRFDAFEQADASTTRKFGGTGLGLRISASLARLLGGSLRVDSWEGEGSRFTVCVDAGRVSEERVRADEPASSRVVADRPVEPSGAQGDRALAGVRVLLVEDGPDNQRLLCFLLRRAGAEVVVAGDGQAAVEVVTLAEAGETFDLVLMDMQMPVLDGYNATRRLRELGCRLPIIALTAHALSGDERVCLEAGCDGYLPKPVNAARLVAECRAWACGDGDRAQAA